MSTPRILLFSYIALAVLVGLVFEQIFASLGGFGPLSFLNRTVMDVENFWAMVLGFAAAAGIALYCWRTPKVREPATQVVEELQRVTWPTMAETRAATFAVILATVIVAAILGVFDYGWGWVTQKVYAP